MNSRYRILSELEDFEDFSGYAIDVSGNLWSLKYKQPKLRKPVWTGQGECSYMACRLRDDRGRPSTNDPLELAELKRKIKTIEGFNKAAL